MTAGVKLCWQREALYLQVVAAVQGRLLSIYDGTTEYNLGQTLHARRGGAAWAPLDACYFAYPSMQQVSVTAPGLVSTHMRSIRLANKHALRIHIRYAWRRHLSAA